MDADARGASMVVKCGLLIDGTGAPPIQDAAIAIEGDRFVAPDSVDHARPGEEEIDLSDYTVLPGLVDCHDHLGFDLGDLEAQVREGPATMALRAARNASRALDAGITTLRDMGAYERLGTLWKEAVQDGLMRGPNLIVAGQWITRTGGHVWFAGREADGVHDIQRAVREQVRNGADWIKLVATGGILTPGSDVLAPTFSEKESSRAVDEAHFLGRPITAHVHGGPALRQTVEAGIDCIEHGTFAEAADFELMAERGTALVATFGALEVGAQNSSLSTETRYKMQQARERYLATLQLAREGGVRVGLGVDMNHGDLAIEVSGLILAGFDHLDAIAAATRVGAEICGVPDTGTIAPGKRADFIAVRGDPAKDWTALRNVEVVFQSGRRVR